MNALNVADDFEELAALIHFHVGAWQDFGYDNPPTPDCAAIPPLGERSASAIKAGHEAVRDIDRLIARLHQVRALLVSELRQDEDIRMARGVPAEIPLRRRPPAEVRERLLGVLPEDFVNELVKGDDHDENHA